MSNITPAHPRTQAPSAPQLFLNLPIEIARLSLRPAAKLVYGALKFHCRHKDVCRVRWAVLQAETGLSRASVGRALADLRREGLVGTLRTGRSSYYVLYPAVPDEGEPTPGPVEADEPAHMAAHTQDVENSARSQIADFHKRDSAKAGTSTTPLPNRVPSTGRDSPEKVGCPETNPFRVLKGGADRKYPQITAPTTVEHRALNPEDPGPIQDGSPELESAPSREHPVKPSETPGIAPLRAFLSAPVEKGGLGWRCHQGNAERVTAYVAQVGLEAATQSAYRCFKQGDDGGAALWDWTLSQAGFHRPRQGRRVPPPA